MNVVNKPDFPVTDAAAKKATGKTLKQWFQELDKIDGLKKGRRACAQHVNSAGGDAWWSTTIAVEYESHHALGRSGGFQPPLDVSLNRMNETPWLMRCDTAGWK